MPQTCTICRHPQRAEIDIALINREPLRRIASRFGTSTATLRRHQSDHLAEKLQQARELQKSADASDLVARLQEIHRETVSILARAKKSKDWATALRAITRLERQIELEAELLGELDHRGAGTTRVEVVYIDKAIITAGRTVAGALPAAETGQGAIGAHPDGR